MLQYYSLQKYIIKKNYNIIMTATLIELLLNI